LIKVQVFLRGNRYVNTFIALFPSIPLTAVTSISLIGKPYLTGGIFPRTRFAMASILNLKNKNKNKKTKKKERNSS